MRVTEEGNRLKGINPSVLMLADEREGVAEPPQHQYELFMRSCDPMNQCLHGELSRFRLEYQQLSLELNVARSVRTGIETD